jgi:transposase
LEQRHGLLKGRHLGIDSNVIEANASLRSLSERNTEEAYWAYVQRLAKEAGIETSDGATLRNFDRHRGGKKMSNEQWQNPHDPDAKIGRTKDGATDMVYLPEHTVDLETGAIVQVQVLAGDHRDSEDLSGRVIEAVLNVQEAQVVTDPEAVPETLTGDKGYFSLVEIGRLLDLTLKTVISDPRCAQRRFDKLTSAERQCLARAQRSVSSKYGRKLVRKRGQHIERSFAHVLDAGGMRRTTLRGLENLNKRHQIAAACFNLSQLLRRLYGVGTPKQWRAFWRLLLAAAEYLLTILLRTLPMFMGLIFAPRLTTLRRSVLPTIMTTQRTAPARHIGCPHRTQPPFRNRCHPHPLGRSRCYRSQTEIHEIPTHHRAPPHRFIVVCRGPQDPGRNDL